MNEPTLLERHLSQRTHQNLLVTSRQMRSLSSIHITLTLRSGRRILTPLRRTVRHCGYETTVAGVLGGTT